MKRMLALTLILSLFLLTVGCAGTPGETTAPTETTDSSETTIPAETTVPTETTAPPETSVPEETEPILETEPYDPEVPHITVYIARQSTEIYIYSIAPAGTEDWTTLVYTGQYCYNEDGPHGAWGQLKYAAPYDGEECTKWRLKLECYPEIVAQWLGMSEVEGEYRAYIFEDVEIIDGVTVLSWQGSLRRNEPQYVIGEGGRTYFIVEDMVFCDRCSQEFRSSYVPEETEPFDYSEPYLSIYLVKWDFWPYRYYIAPMGTEDWVELHDTDLGCGSESRAHGHNACVKYVLPQELLGEGPWQVKRETDMELWQERFGDWDRAPETMYYENVSVYDGVLWIFSYDELLTQDMAYCEKCPEEFRALYQPEE